MRTKIILSFDDGRLDNYYIAKEILVTRNIPATFNITIDYILGKDFPCSNFAMTKENVIELSKQNLFEIAGHGKEHNNDINNLVLGINEIYKWCNIFPKGVASPNSKLNFGETFKRKEEYKKNKIEYIRVGDRFFKFKFVKKILRKLNKYFNNNLINKFIYKDSYVIKNDTFVFPSIPILNYTTEKEVYTLIEGAIKEEKSIIFMFHSICKPEDKFYNDLWSWDYNKFINLCNYLLKLEREEKIEICKMEELVKNRREKC